QKITRRHPSAGIEMEAVNFVPVSGETVELMRVTVRNVSRRPVRVTPTSAVPLFGRALANKHDHEHVTSLLHRTRQLPEGVLVSPTMLFNEEGHTEIRRAYFVFGLSGRGEKSVGSFPTFESFYSDGGTWSSPAAVVENLPPRKLSSAEINGKETVGALRFKDETLKPGASREYLIMFGTASDPAEAGRVFRRFSGAGAFDRAWDEVKAFWRGKTRSISFASRDRDFDSWMNWVMLQPILRRIWGCSFLPDHDYGKGGKGWRDLWQDLLSLIMIEPETVRGDLINNFKGIRVDGSNATIIGEKPGEFVADRNAISRVWMDHGVWPLLTALLYIHQTGDENILFESATYFRDPQLSRGMQKDLAWVPSYGRHLKTKSGQVYEGSVLEHLLIQHLVPFFNVGEHNLIRLENADWNDGLDMASQRGESVAFMAMYGGNLFALADVIEHAAQTGSFEEIQVSREVLTLLDTMGTVPCRYDSVQDKKSLLFDAYFPSVQPEISGEKVGLPVKDVAADLRRKGNWIFGKIRDEEIVTVKNGGKTHRWFNGYYDNQGRRVEGRRDGKIRMTLTGQVFPIMSGLAGEKDIKDVIASVRQFLKDKALGGYRLNTDFGVRNDLDLGRAFSFAYGTKENGAFFSHMAVMYAYALYRAGFVREGNEVLRSIVRMCGDTGLARIYPGIPEYFDSEGRGMYHYLTGSASWMILTLLTQVFGIRGEYGDLVINPKLVKEQFSRNGEAGSSFSFAGRKVTVVFENKAGLDYGQYAVKKVLSGEKPLEVKVLSPACVKIKRATLKGRGELVLRVVLGK
ncbi:MAG: cellobiose phosphorylase, partial [Candidatus Omnitrophota bacterium]|nr:cellobiose phosphorylase [Candidatus Omnitrophota bacterium]